MVASVQNRTAQLNTWIQWGFKLNRPVTRLLLLLTLVVSLAPFVRGSAVQASLGATPVESSTLTADTQLANLLADGQYLYGESPEANQLGAGYMVFEASQGNIVGALYMPHSSFDCFRGRVQDGALAMTITNSYTQETYPYSVAVVTDDAIASATNVTAPLQLDGFHRLGEPSDNDLRMLEVCKANLQ